MADVLTMRLCFGPLLIFFSPLTQHDNLINKPSVLAVEWRLWVAVGSSNSAFFVGFEKFWKVTVVSVVLFFKKTTLFGVRLGL